MKSNKVITIMLVSVLLLTIVFTCNTSQVGAPNVITVLHTNDIHSQVLPVAQGKGRWAGYGGFAKMAHVIDSVRSKVGEVLLFSMGDFCQGTPFFNFYKGELEIEYMNKIGYTASTLGNHEYDNGLESLATMVKKAQFPFVVSNYEFTGTPLEGLIKPYHILTFKGVKIGLIGLTVNVEGMVAKDSWQGVKYLDPISSAQKYADTLHAKGVDMVICMSHLGENSNQYYIGDDSLSASTSGIDLILGGHSHTEGINVLKNAKGQDVTITQAGSQGRLIGQVDVYVEPVQAKK